MTYKLPTRADKLIAQADKDAYTACGGEASADRLAFECGALRGYIRKLCDELATYTGEGYKPDPGSDTMEVFAEDAPFLIEFEFSPGTESKTSGPPEDCYEGDPTEVAICGALVNGEWVDPANLFNQTIIDGWEQEIIDAEMESAQDQRESRYAGDDE